MEEKELKNVKLLAAKVRRDVLSMLQHRGYGHVGGSLSLVEAYAVLYGKQLRYDASNPHWDERDRVVLSKGHAGPVMYSTLAECGFFPKEWLNTLNDGGTRLPSHTDRLKTPGVDATTGSLGQGTSEAVGGVFCASNTASALCAGVENSASSNKSKTLPCSASAKAAIEAAGGSVA